MHEAFCNLYTTSQEKSATCSEYLKKSQMVVDFIESVEGSIGHHPKLATEAIKEMGVIVPSSEENRKAATDARQKYLAAAFLMGSDCRRYGYLIEDPENSFAKGNNEWLKTLDISYALLTNWKQDQRFTGSALQDGRVNGINYHMRDEDSDAQLHTTAGGGGKKGGRSSNTQVHIQSSEPRDATVTPCEISQTADNIGMQLEQVALSAAR